MNKIDYDLWLTEYEMLRTMKHNMNVIANLLDKSNPNYPCLSLDDLTLLNSLSVVRKQELVDEIYINLNPEDQERAFMHVLSH